MNIALSALIILLLLLPALFFRLGISMVRNSAQKPDERDKFSRDLVRKNFVNILSKLNFSETLLFFSIVPLLLHIISLSVLHWSGEEIDYKLLLNVFSSQKNIIDDNMAFNTELISYLQYILAETIIGFLLGWLFTYIIMQRPTLLRSLVGDNIWFKVFTGLLLKKDVRDKVDAILVDIVTEMKETTVIYSGFLEKFDINPETGQIEYITLTTATRRDLRQGSQITELTGVAPAPNVKTSVYLDTNGPLITIPGKYLTILGSKISNVNVTYMDLVITKDAQGNVTSKDWQVIG